MSSTGHWLIRNVFVSLLPILISALIFFLIYKGLTWNMIDPGLYSFSMAMLSLVFMAQFSANNENDKDLSSSISIIYTAFIAFFMAIFTYVIILKIQNEKYVSQIIDNFTQSSLSIPIGKIDIINNLISMRADTLSSLEFVRIFPVMLSIALFAYSITIKLKYNMVD